MWRIHFALFFLISSRLLASLVMRSSREYSNTVLLLTSERGRLCVTAAADCFAPNDEGHDWSAWWRPRVGCLARDNVLAHLGAGDEVEEVAREAQAAMVAEVEAAKEEAKLDAPEPFNEAQARVASEPRVATATEA